MGRWSRAFQELVGDLPADYMAFDLETTGFIRERDLPVDIGVVIVREREVVFMDHFVLDWTSYAQVDQTTLARRLRRVGQEMARDGRRWVYTPAYLRQHGEDPLWVLDQFHDLLWTNREAGASLVGHNAWSFDLAMLHYLFEECGGTFRCEENELFDTGGMEKALQLEKLPRPGETLKEFFARVINHRVAGVRWNIAECVDRYGLLTSDSPFGKEQLHTALADAYFTHRLMELHRSLGDEDAENP